LVKKVDFIKAAEGQEGYLFPDTYTFPVNTSSQDIIQVMKRNFEGKTRDLKPNLETMVLASIIEREAKYDEDRAEIASVYLNRLRTGMRLEADPTVQYAKGSWESITSTDYHSVFSPYNTYLHAGLPPGPICNPGLASIQAASNPSKTDYFYFLTTRDGHAVFSKTFEEHKRKIRQYF
jgi:UPF0755 protein